MKGEFTAIIEKAPEGGYWAACPEIPGANGHPMKRKDLERLLRMAGCYLKREGRSLNAD